LWGKALVGLSEALTSEPGAGTGLAAAVWAGAFCAHAMLIKTNAATADFQIDFISCSSQVQGSEFQGFNIPCHGEVPLNSLSLWNFEALKLCNVCNLAFL
jgi:hypothetical protein